MQVDAAPAQPDSVPPQNVMPAGDASDEETEVSTQHSFGIATCTQMAS